MSESIFKLEFEAAAIDVERLKNFKHFFYRRDSTQIDLILGPADHRDLIGIRYNYNYNYKTYYNPDSRYFRNHSRQFDRFQF